MKMVLENIRPSGNSSFNWLINPKLNDFYFWHFHPEYELVFIEADQGIRQVGTHKGKFRGSDMVLIGSNIPHLNFDYGIRTPYQKTVVHINPQFLEKSHTTPELKPIVDLLELSRYGLCFGKKIKQQVGAYFKSIHTKSPIDQFVHMVQLLHLLSTSKDYKPLHKKTPGNLFNKKESDRIAVVNDFIRSNYTRKISIHEVAGLVHLNHAAFCRYFKKMTKLTFIEFLNHYRINEAKNILIRDRNVSQACFASGFESLSYFNRIFKRVTGMNPLQFKKEWSRT